MGRRRELRPGTLTGLPSILAVGVCGMPVLLGFGLPVAVFVKKTVEAGDARAGELRWSLGRDRITQACLSSGIAVVLGTLIAYSRRLHPNWFVKLTARVAGVGYAIPRRRDCDRRARLGVVDRRLRQLGIGEDA